MLDLRAGGVAVRWLAGSGLSDGDGRCLRRLDVRQVDLLLVVFRLRSHDVDWGAVFNDGKWGEGKTEAGVDGNVKEKKYADDSSSTRFCRGRRENVGS